MKLLQKIINLFPDEQQWKRNGITQLWVSTFGKQSHSWLSRQHIMNLPRCPQQKIKVNVRE
jgi:hypothetical protein